MQSVAKTQTHCRAEAFVRLGEIRCGLLCGMLGVVCLASCGRSGAEQLDDDAITPQVNAQSQAQPQAPAGRPVQLADPRHPCGAVVVSAVTRALGKPVLLKEAVAAVRCDPLGRATLADVSRALRKLGFHCVGAHLSVADARRVGGPLVLHVDDQHFVMGVPTTERSMVLIDPPSAPSVQTAEQLQTKWSGDCLIVDVDAESLAAKMAAIGLSMPEDGIAEK
jgi:hypothetical protein